MQSHFVATFIPLDPVHVAIHHPLLTCLALNVFFIPPDPDQRMRRPTWPCHMGIEKARGFRDYEGVSHHVLSISEGV